jgi:hypothetical protein
MTYPAGLMRVFNYLRDVGPATCLELAEHCFVVPRHAQYCVTQLAELGLVHIGGWRRQFGAGARFRRPLAVWHFGYGKTACRVVDNSAKSARDRRVKRLREEFGDEIASRILASRSNGGADRIVVDGRTLYERGKPRGYRRAA